MPWLKNKKNKTPKHFKQFSNSTNPMKKNYKLVLIKSIE